MIRLALTVLAIALGLLADPGKARPAVACDGSDASAELNAEFQGVAVMGNAYVDVGNPIAGVLTNCAVNTGKSLVCD